MDRDALLERARTRGVNPLVYWLVRAVLQPFFHVYFRLSRIGREHIPAEGPVILASNHRSFLDPFVIGVMARRPIYYVAKRELFLFHPVVSWLLSALGAFPIERGASDQGAMATAKAILERGDIVLMFPEGTRVRPGSLGRARRRRGRPPSHSHWSSTHGQMRSVTAPASAAETRSVRGKRSGRPARMRTLCGRMRQPFRTASVP